MQNIVRRHTKRCMACIHAYGPGIKWLEEERDQQHVPGVKEYGARLANEVRP